MNQLNEKDIKELMDRGFSEKEINDLKKKGFTKKEIIDLQNHRNEISKGVFILDVVEDIITWVTSFLF